MKLRKRKQKNNQKSEPPQSTMASPADPRPQPENQTTRTENPDTTRTESEVEPVLQQNPDSESHSQSKSLTLVVESPQDQETQQNPPQSDSKQAKPDDSNVTFYRRGTKRKKSGSKQRAVKGKKSEQKFQLQRTTLRPIPFVPVKNLDFERHEKLLKRLNLWDFVHIEFDRTLRVDLLAQLISNFSPTLRSSYVDGVRVMVNRADLARALKLPVKKTAVADGSEDLPPASEESIAFIEDFVSNWVLLHEDTWMMPGEVLNWTKAIKEGNLGKRDWAGLIWFMVEKELAQAPKLGDCYYASHLQCLIKSQREELLMAKEQKARVDVDVHMDVDVDVDINADAAGGAKEEEQEEGGGNGDAKKVLEDDFEGRGLEEHNIGLSLGQENVEGVDVGKGKEHKVELSLGQENAARVGLGEEDVEEEQDGVEKEQDGDEKEQDGVEKEQDGVEKEQDGVEKEQDGVEDAMDFEGSKVEEPAAQWLLDGKLCVSKPFLRWCNVGEGKNVGSAEVTRKDMEVAEGGAEEGNEEEEEVEEQEQEDGFHLSLNGMTLDGLSSGNLIQTMEGEQSSLSSGMQIRDHLRAELLSSREDSRMLHGGSSLFEIGLKRELIHENSASHHHPPLNANKRLSIDEPWDGKLPGDFETCMEQMQHWMEKARMVYVGKEQACQQSTVEQQMLLEELQQREEMIDHLQKAKAEEQNKRQVEVYRLERELYVMGNLLHGYRKALKETQKAFSEYRARCRQADEPLYQDVPESGGLVLSIMELEQQRLKKEEEVRMSRQLVEKNIRDFEAGWITIFEGHHKNVESLSSRLTDVDMGVKFLKERLAKRRIAEVPESGPNGTECAR